MEDMASTSREQCSICMDEITGKAVLDLCLHEFCYVCIVEWSERKTECPLCKRPFEKILHQLVSDQDYKELFVGSRLPEDVHSHTLIFHNFVNEPLPSTSGFHANVELPLGMTRFRLSSLRDSNSRHNISDEAHLNVVGVSPLASLKLTNISARCTVFIANVGPFCSIVVDGVFEGSLIHIEGVRSGSTVNITQVYSAEVRVQDIEKAANVKVESIPCRSSISIIKANRGAVVLVEHSEDPASSQTVSENGRAVSITDITNGAVVAVKYLFGEAIEVKDVSHGRNVSIGSPTPHFRRSLSC